MDHGIITLKPDVPDHTDSIRRKLDFLTADGINIKFSLIGEGNENSNLNLYVVKKAKKSVRPSVRPGMGMYLENAGEEPPGNSDGVSVPLFME